MNLRVLFVLALCALTARPAQAEPVAASSDSLSEQLAAMVERYRTKADKRENGSLRIAKKVGAGTGLSVTAAAILTSVRNASESESDFTVGRPLLFAANLFFANMVVFPVGVTLVDPHDSFVHTLLGSVVPGLGGLVLGGLALGLDVRELAVLGLVVSSVGSPVGSIIASEKSRNPSQDRRASFGLSPTPNGSLSVVFTLRF